MYPEPYLASFTPRNKKSSHSSSEKTSSEFDFLEIKITRKQNEKVRQSKYKEKIGIFTQISEDKYQMESVRKYLKLQVGYEAPKLSFFMNLSFNLVCHELYKDLAHSWIALVIKKLSKTPKLNII